MKIYLKDGIYIPIKKVTDDQIEKVVEKFQRHVYLKEKVCERCEFYSERPCDTCSSCPNYGGLYKLFKEEEFKGKMCLRLPYGDRASVKKIFGPDLELVDLTPDIPMKKTFKMTVDLKEYQGPAVKDMMKVRSGILKSPPRSGKTVMASAYIAKRGLKTIILASQQDWLDNFMETFIGSDTQPAMTTISKKRIGYCKKLEHFEKYDVCLATYQTFLSKGGKKLLKKIRSMFSVMVVDEIQYGAALEFSRVISAFNCRYKFGLSGTPERKDTLHFILYKIMGKIFHETDVARLKPRIEIVEPPSMPALPKTWTYAVSKLEQHPERLKFIAKEAIKDAKAGHIVLIPLARIPVIKALKQAINIMADKRIAIDFHGETPKGQKHKNNRKSIIDKLRNRKYKVMVGNIALLSTGINIPAASMLYQVTPSSNLPKAEQRFSRVLTPMEGKRQPVFKYFIDDIDIVRNCMRTEHFGAVWPLFRPMMDPATKGRLENYFKGKKKSFVSKDGFSGDFL